MTITKPSHRQCLQTALRMLGRRDHAVQELVEKLQTKGYPSNAVQWTIDECIRFNYLNDEKYAAAYTRSAMHRGYGPLRITQYLKAKGVSGTLIAAAIEGQFDNAQQTKVCRHVLEKKLKASTTQSDPAKLKASLNRFLFNRGFKPDTVRQVIAAGLKP